MKGGGRTSAYMKVANAGIDEAHSIYGLSGAGVGLKDRPRECVREEGGDQYMRHERTHR